MVFGERRREGEKRREGGVCRLGKVADKGGEEEEEEGISGGTVEH